MGQEHRGPALVLITGPPGRGKTTLVKRVFEHYSKKGLAVSGIITEETRTGGERSGFKIRDLTSGEEGWLARTGDEAGPRIGRYRVAVGDVERVGVRALEAAAKGDGDLVLIDEVGPMEMTVSSFRKALSEAFNSGKIVVATVRYGSHYSEVEDASKGRDVKRVLVSPNDRDAVFHELVGIIDGALTAARE